MNPAVGEFNLGASPIFSLLYKNPETLEKALENRVEKIAADFDIRLDSELFLKEKFAQLLEKLSHEQKAVVLIDEYDKPMIEYVEADKIETALEIRGVLKNFYGVLKGSDPFLRFVFITGVSKFSRVSVFSDLNNLIDLTLMADFSTLLGYTGSELQHYFSPYIDRLSEELGTPPKELTEAIQQWYDGYSWDGKNFVYNPFSILNMFNTRSFENFWFSSGTPTFLIKLLKEQQGKPMDFENLPVKSYTFDSYDIENLDIAALLFQTGYLTVKKITSKDILKPKTYHLSFPNLEVRNSFFTLVPGGPAARAAS